MRLEDLEVFRAVHDTGSFQRAALRAGLSQSAVTKVVRRLEDEFGVQLLERSSRLVALTPAGRTLYQRATELAGLAALTRQDMAGEEAALRGSIRLGVVPALLDSLMTPVLAELVSLSHAAKTHLSVLPSTELVHLVEQGKLDLAVCFGAQRQQPHVVRMVVGRQRYRLVVRTEHRLVGRTPSLEDLVKLHWLLPEPDVTLRQEIDQIFANAGLGPLDVRVETNTSANMLLKLLASSDLVAVIAEQKLQPLSSHGLTTLDVDLAPLLGDVAIYYRRRAPSVGLLAHLRNRLEAQARNNFSD